MVKTLSAAVLSVVLAATIPTPPVAPMNASGNVVIGSALYRLTYKLPQDGTPTPYDVKLTRIGGGWDRFVAYESAKSPTARATTSTRSAATARCSAGPPTAPAWRGPHWAPPPGSRPSRR
jgi:hypothetical protein